MIEIRRVGKLFGAVAALDDVSFDIDKPQMLGIIGRSGAGKSTLLRVINRLTTATSGEVRFEGTNVLALKGAEKQRWQRNCAMIFQQFNLVPRLDVLTNVMLGRLNGHGVVRSLCKMFSDNDRALALIALERLGIAEASLQRAENLSGGQQQRVAIARALVQQPKILLADEPIASLDPMNAKIVMESLRQIHDKDGLTVMANLHTLDTARCYCDRVIGMRGGKVVFDGPASSLTEAAARDIYGAEELDEAMTSTSIRAPGKGFRPVPASGIPAVNGAGAVAAAG